MCVVSPNRYLNFRTPELGGVICMIYVSGAHTYIVPGGRWHGGERGGGGGRNTCARAGLTIIIIPN